MMDHKQSIELANLRTAYRQGRDMHVRDGKRRIENGWKLSDAHQKLLDACREFDATPLPFSTSYEERRAHVVRMLELLWTYGVHSWCSDNRWRWYVAGVIGRGLE